MRQTSLAPRVADEAESQRGNRNLLFELAALGLFLPGLLLIVGCVVFLATIYSVKIAPQEAPGTPDFGSFGVLAAALCWLVPAAMFLLAGAVLRFFLSERKEG